MVSLYDQVIKNTARLESKIQLSCKHSGRKKERGTRDQSSGGRNLRNGGKKRRGEHRGQKESLRTRLDLISRTVMRLALFSFHSSSQSSRKNLCKCVVADQAGEMYM